MDLITVETLECILQENTKDNKGVLYWEGKKGIYGQIEWEKQDDTWLIVYKINHSNGYNYYIRLMEVKELVGGVAQIITNQGVSIDDLYSITGSKP
jgi:hypothetical protein